MILSYFKKHYKLIIVCSAASLAIAGLVWSAVILVQREDNANGQPVFGSSEEKESTIIDVTDDDSDDESAPELGKTLSDDLSSRMFNLGDDVYTLPVHFSELEANGWSICDRSNTPHVVSYMVDPGSFALWVFVTDGSRFAVVSFMNLSFEVLPVNKTHVTYISASDSIAGVQPFFPGNITVGSTYEDVIAAYGEPNERNFYEGFELHSLEYFRDNIRVLIRICDRTMLVTRVFMDYWGWVSKTPAPEPTPTELGDELDSRMFSLDGVTYTMPVHFSEFESNGWSFYDPNNRDSEGILVPGGFFPWVEFLAENQNIGVTITNLTEGTSKHMSDSYITNISLYPGYHNAQFILPGNITIGSTHRDVIAAYGEPCSRYVPEQSPYHRLFYISENLVLQLGIDTESNQVALITMQYWNPTT